MGVGGRAKRSVLRSGLLAVGAAALLLVTTGCAPQALGFEHVDTIEQGLPIALARTAWGGVDLDNTSGSPIVLQKLHLAGLINATVSHVRVIKVTSGNGFGFYYPPVTAGMRAELANAKPLHGFTLPARSRGQYEVVFLMSVIDPTQDAASSTAEVTYTAGWGTWTETRNSGFCMFASPDHGCDRSS